MGAHLSAVHINGSLNVIADQLSQRLSVPREWSLNLEIFQVITQKWSYPEGDLMATGQCQGGEVLLSLPRGQSLGNRCPVHPLEVQAGSYIPSSFHNNKGINENQTGPSQGHFHHTILAEKSLVFPTHTDESWDLLEASLNSEPCVSGHSALPRSESVQLDSLEVDQSLLWSRGLSEAFLNTLSLSREKSINWNYAYGYVPFLIPGLQKKDCNPYMTYILECCIS